MKNVLEILAPAGDFESLEAAVLFGADSVYLGGEIFGMRANAKNFSEDLLKKAVDFCHENGVNLYLTCNTIPTNQEVEKLPHFLKFASEIGVDGLIVADFGTILEAKELIPKIPLHISTQVGVTNYKTANALFKLGAKRIVLARELSLKDMEIIRKNTPKDLELEVFVHGSVCMSFSGRCLLSQYLTGRDSNRGDCAQPCRWGYCLVEEKRPGQSFPIFEEDGYSYILNSKDLCLIEHLNKLRNVGIDCIKIEGRAKSSHYVATVTNAYKIAVEILTKSEEKNEEYILPSWVKDELNKVSHRHYSTGFLFNKPENGQFHESGGYIRTYEIVGIVQNCNSEYILIKQKNKISVGDLIEILEPLKKPILIKVEEILDENLKNVDFANNNEKIFHIKCAKKIAKGSILRKLKM